MYQARLCPTAHVRRQAHRKRHSRAYTPQGRCKVERIFGVIQQQLYPELLLEKVSTLELLNECLWAWLERVYHVRVHSETG